MSRVFMDGGSGINLIFASTLRAMRIPLTCLEASNITFHGNVPGKGVYPLSKINLDVIFDTPKNFGVSASTLKSSTGPHNTTASSDVSRSLGSW